MNKNIFFFFFLSDYGNDFYQQAYYQEDFDDNLPNEIVAELNAREHLQSNLHDDDESIFSDAVQDAFKKYQNEVDHMTSRTYDDAVYSKRKLSNKRNISVF